MHSFCHTQITNILCNESKEKEQILCNIQSLLEKSASQSLSLKNQIGLHCRTPRVSYILYLLIGGTIEASTLILSLKRI
jgi:hypothetical protein